MKQRVVDHRIGLQLGRRFHELQELEGLGDAVGAAEALHEDAEGAVISSTAHAVAEEVAGRVDVGPDEDVEDGVEDLEGRWVARGEEVEEVGGAVGPAGPAEGPDEGDDGGLRWGEREGEKELVGLFEVVEGDEGLD